MDARRKDFILRMAYLAEIEPEEHHDGDDLITRTMHYAGSAVPKVTRGEVEETLDSVDHVIPSWLWLEEER